MTLNSKSKKGAFSGYVGMGKPLLLTAKHYIMSKRGQSLSPWNDPRLKRVRRLSRLLDEQFRIPGTMYRGGLDSLLGLIPGVGDAASTLLSSYIVYEAIRYGVPRRILLHMVANLALDTVVGAIPILGDIFDIAWKANKKNVALLEKHLASQQSPPDGDRHSGAYEPKLSR